MANRIAGVLLPKELEWFGKRKSSRFPVALIWLIGAGVATPFVVIGAIVGHGLMTSEPSIQAPASAPVSQAGAQAKAEDPPSAPSSSAAPEQLQPVQTVTPPTESVPVTGYEAVLAAAQDMLKSHLPENRGLMFRDVRTILASQDGQEAVTFCGQLNMQNPAGAYTGFQRFISSPADASVEQNMTPGDFAAAWSGRCAGREGPIVWR